MKCLTALLAVVAALCISDAALAGPAVDRGPAESANSPVQQDLRSPDRVAPAAAPLQDLRAPDRTMSGASGGSLAPESVVASGSSAASTDAISTSGGGLSALWIVLISVGGALALAAIAYTAIHVVHARHAHIVS